MLTTFNEVNMTPIFELRKKYKEEFKEKHGVGLGFMSFFTKATVNALKEFPDVYSMIDGDQQVKYDFFDISIAVSGPKGLMVPVVRDAQNLTFSGIEKEIKRLAIRARDGEITVDEIASVVAHELGHGVHQILAAKNGLLMSETPLTLAETASVFGEMLVFRKLLDESSTEQKKQLLAGKIEDMLNTVARQIGFHQFEVKFHEARIKSELIPFKVTHFNQTFETKDL